MAALFYTCSDASCLEGWMLDVVGKIFARIIQDCLQVQ